MRKNINNSCYQTSYITGESIMYKVLMTKNKNIYMRVKDNEIIVLTNKWTSETTLKKFVDKHIGRFKEKIENRKKLERINKELDFIWIFDKKYGTKLISNSKRNNYEIIKNKIYITKTNKSSIDMVLKSIYLKETSKYILERTRELAKKMNAKVGKISFKWVDSTFGKYYTNSNNITYSLKLGSFPKDVIDYCIVHELCHYFRADHSKKFWEKVEFFLPNYKELSKKLLLQNKI